MVAEFIMPDDPRWSAALDSLEHDFYHLPEYLEFCAKHEGGTAVAFYAEDGDAVFLAPLLIRDIDKDLGAPDDWSDATAPYGYPSPIVSAHTDAATLERLLYALKRESLEHGIVSIFFRLHPLLELRMEALERLGTIVNHGQIVYMDLTRSEEEIWSGVRRNHREGIRRLQKAGFSGAVDDGSHLKEFSRIYSMTMERVGAVDFYKFSEEYFMELKAALGKRFQLMKVVSPNGDLASGGIFITTNGLSQYHLGASSDDYFELAPSKLVYDFAWRHAKAQGCKTLFLGGGLGGATGSLMRFKLGFSKQLAEFYTYRMILDADKYEYLMRLWAQRCNGTDSETGYFPGYRAPYERS